MVVVELAGGLGNQLFEYAVGRHVALVNRRRLKLDVTTGFGSDTFYRRRYALEPFNVKAEFAQRRDLERVWTPRAGYRLGKTLQWLRRMLPQILARHVPAWGSMVFTERIPFTFEPQLLEPTPNNVLLRGYWQNPRYFDDIHTVLSAEFTLRSRLSPRASGYRDAILSAPSVAIHCRRLLAHAFGRFNPEAVSLHGYLDPDYYARAVRLIGSACRAPHFFVFADDMSWAVEHLRLDGPTTLVMGNRDYEDLILMSQCRHQIIANSSFGWWAAWLNQYPGKMIIAPEKYVADKTADLRNLYPVGWKRL